ncbi:hypothetical protein [Williamsia sp.]|uniref:hypothetical protein n=1 Tax=Williamsia sp. TaxID=1872085 RepID=UPI001A25C91A|nr:hypothetical protein [Williamsia sp.]MBJ7289192.1 hypothetical protein [Williamsia sp.]
MNSDPNADATFVDKLLRQAQNALGDDPRIRFAHVRHSGPPPAELFAPAPRPQGRAVRSAWSQTRSLAELLRDLWEHAWLPHPPATVGVRYVDDGSGIRVKVVASATSVEQPRVETVGDRLLVRGFIPDDALPGEGFAATGGRHRIVVAVAGGEVSVTLSTILDNDAELTLNALAALPTEISTTPDRPKE